LGKDSWGKQQCKQEGHGRLIFHCLLHVYFDST
jgi:hypothetical protein